MTDGTRTRVLIGFHVLLVALSVGAYRWFKRPAAAEAAVPQAAPIGSLAQVPLPEARQGRVQVALLLDTSGSMSGLIDQARSQLWKVVTELDRARHNGQRPQLEIALYEYGNPSHATAQAGWVRQVLPFSTELDRVSEALFALTTDGGDEFVGQVLQTATRDLAWSPRTGDMKMMFVAGNESFDQGTVPASRSIAEAEARGINVNVIVCGDHDPSWARGARLAHSDLMVIDHNAAPMHIAAPQDAEIERLGLALNDTYIGYGAEGAQGVARQRAQDDNAAHAQKGSGLWRARSKSSVSYNNARWDLGDAIKGGRVDIDKLAASDLPENMKAMSVDERKAYVQKKLADRAEVQTRIRDLSTKRDAFVAEARKKASVADNGASLDSAMLKATRTKATAVGLTFE